MPHADAVRARKAHHQVDRQIVEAGGSGVAYRGAGLTAVVNAVEHLQLAVVERLYADAEPVEEPQSCKAFKILRRKVFGVGLDGGLLELRQVAVGAYGIDNFSQLAYRQHRRGSAAKVDSAQRPVGATPRQLNAQSRDILLDIPAAGHGIEGAVGAFVMAIWDVDV